MAHPSSAGGTVVCPNCGHAATHNYCAQCGQENHLHKDTLRGLILHFAGHYFHYDSKFWKTIKALWTAPGALTKAYLEGKRARFIPPISLYIFVSAVFFVSEALLPEALDQPGQKREATISVQHIDAAGAQRSDLDAAAGEGKAEKQMALRRLSQRLRQIDEAPAEKQKEFAEKFEHQFPKIFFLMIPFTALMLTLAFARRKGAHMVHHAIFSLHVHSFFFSLFLLQVLNPFERIDNWLRGFLLLVFGIYVVAALRRVYGVGYARAVVTALLIGLGYLIVLLIAFVAIALYVISSMDAGSVH